MPGRIKLTDTAISSIVKLSEGVPGAAVVCTECYKRTPSIDPNLALGGLAILLDFDDLGIYGTDIWVLFKYVCGQDYVNLNALFRGRQLGFIREQAILSAIQERKPLDFPPLLAKIRKELPDFGKDTGDGDGPASGGGRGQDQEQGKIGKNYAEADI